MVHTPIPSFSFVYIFYKFGIVCRASKKGMLMWSCFNTSKNLLNFFSCVVFLSLLGKGGGGLSSTRLEITFSTTSCAKALSSNSIHDVIDVVVTSLWTYRLGKFDCLSFFVLLISNSMPFHNPIGLHFSLPFSSWVGVLVFFFWKWSTLSLFTILAYWPIWFSK